MAYFQRIATWILLVREQILRVAYGDMTLVSREKREGGGGQGGRGRWGEPTFRIILRQIISQFSLFVIFGAVPAISRFLWLFVCGWSVISFPENEPTFVDFAEPNSAFLWRFKPLMLDDRSQCFLIILACLCLVYTEVNNSKRLELERCRAEEDAEFERTIARLGWISVGLSSPSPSPSPHKLLWSDPFFKQLYRINYIISYITVNYRNVLIRF